MSPDETPTEVIPRIDEPPTNSFPVPPLGVAGAGMVAGVGVWSPPRRPWRRVLCWLTGGHFYYPHSAGCLECGKAPRRTVFG